MRAGAVVQKETGEDVVIDLGECDIVQVEPDDEVSTALALPLPGGFRLLAAQRAANGVLHAVHDRRRCRPARRRGATGRRDRERLGLYAGAAPEAGVSASGTRARPDRARARAGRRRSGVARGWIGSAHSERNGAGRDAGGTRVRGAHGTAVREEPLRGARLAAHRGGACGAVVRVDGGLHPPHAARRAHRAASRPGGRLRLVRRRAASRFVGGARRRSNADTGIGAHPARATTRLRGAESVRDDRLGPSAHRPQHPRPSTGAVARCVDVTEGCPMPAPLPPCRTDAECTTPAS